MTSTQSPPRPSPRDAASTFPNAWTLLHVRGVPVRLDRSWLVIAALVVWQLHGAFTRVLAEAHGGLVLATATVAALLFFASILAHELGHCFTSLDRGIPVLSVTLFMFGGVTESTREARSARDEFVIVGIGPFVSLVLAALFGLLYTAAEGVRPLAAVFGYLAWINLSLAIFNVIPGYPLDGGRLLRAALWWGTGAPHRATRWAARVGQVFALLLMAAGLYDVVGFGQGLGGFWSLLIGFFLLRGATEAHTRARGRERLAGQTAADVMGSVPPALRPTAPLDEAIAQVQQRPSLLWPVGDPVQGAVRLEDFDQIPADLWPGTTVWALAAPAAQVTVDAEVPMDAVLERLVQAPGQMLVVTRGGRPVGLITPSLVADLLK